MKKNGANVAALLNKTIFSKMEWSQGRGGRSVSEGERGLGSGLHHSDV